MQIKNSDRVNFTSLNKQKLLGECVLREFKKEIGCLQSSSKIDMRRMQMEKVLDNDFNIKLARKCNKLHAQIDEYLEIFFDSDASFASLNQFTESLFSGIKMNGNKANCFENMIWVINKLKNKGQKPEGIQVTLNFGEYTSNHFSSVFGLKKNAYIRDPKTWGTQAYIVDSWLNVCGPAFEVMKQIKNNLSCGYKADSMEIAPVNLRDYINYRV